MYRTLVILWVVKDLDLGTQRNRRNGRFLFRKRKLLVNDFTDYQRE